MGTSVSPWLEAAWDTSLEEDEAAAAAAVAARGTKVGAMHKQSDAAAAAAAAADSSACDVAEGVEADLAAAAADVARLSSEVAAGLGLGEVAAGEGNSLRGYRGEVVSEVAAAEAVADGPRDNGERDERMANILALRVVRKRLVRRVIEVLDTLDQSVA
jgi:hypothetical protein